MITSHSDFPAGVDMVLLICVKGLMFRETARVLCLRRDMLGNGKTSRCASLLEWDGCCCCGEGSLKVGGRQSRRAWRPYYFRPVSPHRNLQTSVIGSLSDLHIYIQSLFTPK